MKISYGPVEINLTIKEAKTLVDILEMFQRDSFPVEYISKFSEKLLEQLNEKLSEIYG